LIIIYSNLSSFKYALLEPSEPHKNIKCTEWKAAKNSVDILNQGSQM